MSLRRWSALAKQSLEHSARSRGIGVIRDGIPETDDPAKSSSANDDNSVTFKAVMETAGDNGKHLPEELIDPDNKVSSTESDLAVSDDNPCPSTDDEDNRVLFNADIVCSEHGGLRTDVWTRCSLILAGNWRRLTEQLAANEYIEIPATQSVCCLCESSNIAEKNQVDVRKKLACYQRSQLSDLYYGKNRPPASCSCLYLVSVDFVNDWKSFIRDPVRCSIVEAVNNGQLLCSHGKLCAELPSTVCWDDNGTSAKVMYVREDEWQSIQQLFKVDVELRREVVVDDVGQDSVVLVPEMCAKCYAEQLQAKYLAQMVYENATIYVSKVAEVDRTIAHTIDSVADTATGLDASSTAFNNALMADDYVSVTDEQNPEIANKRKLSCSSGSVESKIRKLGMASAAAASDVQPTRRSNRVKQSKNSWKQFTVSSSVTLRELKMKIAREYEVLKTDQHLFFDGQELLDDDATLQTLSIPQHAHLLLKIDELPMDQSSMGFDALDVIANRTVMEKGFKGTLLTI